MTVPPAQTNRVRRSQPRIAQPPIGARVKALRIGKLSEPRRILGYTMRIDLETSSPHTTWSTEEHLWMASTHFFSAELLLITNRTHQKSCPMHPEAMS